jgi:hypothetical protein
LKIHLSSFYLEPFRREWKLKAHTRLRWARKNKRSLSPPRLLLIWAKAPVLSNVHDQQTIQKEVTKKELPYKTIRRRPNSQNHRRRKRHLFQSRGNLWQQRTDYTKNYSDLRKNKIFTRWHNFSQLYSATDRF